MYLTRTYTYSLYRYVVLIPVYEIVPPENPYRRPHASDTTLKVGKKVDSKAGLHSKLAIMSMHVARTE